MSWPSVCGAALGAHAVAPDTGKPPCSGRPAFSILSCHRSDPVAGFSSLCARLEGRSRLAGMHAVGLMQAGRELGFGRRVFVWEGRGSWAVGFDGESRILDRIFVRRV